MAVFTKFSEGMELALLIWSTQKNMAVRRFTTRVTQTLSIPSSSHQKPEKSRDSHNARIQRYFNEKMELKSIIKLVPEKYFVANRKRLLHHLYLVNKVYAKEIAKIIFNHVKDKNQIICETNAGLGLISQQLLNKGIKKIRVYESCVQFRTYLESLTKYSSRMEIYNKDIYRMYSLSYLDKHDKGHRVHQMLQRVPIRRWCEDPGMVIIGPMPNQNFIKYLTRMIISGQEIVEYGRPEIFALMLPGDYTILNASPDMRLHTYQTNSILFQLFFDCELLDKYCKKSFLPWKYNGKVVEKEDEDYIFLVKITPKAKLPVSNDYLLHLYYYVKQGFQRGRKRVIPTLEQWLPGIGAELIIMSEKYDKYFPTSIDIYTEFGQLNPTQILQIFLVMLDQSDFTTSPFMPMMLSHLVKDETVETVLADVDHNVTDATEEENETNLCIT